MTTATAGTSNPRIIKGVAAVGVLVIAAGLLAAGWHAVATSGMRTRSDAVVSQNRPGPIGAAAVAASPEPVATVPPAAPATAASPPAARAGAGSVAATAAAVVASPPAATAPSAPSSSPGEGAVVAAAARPARAPAPRPAPTSPTPAPSSVLYGVATPDGTSNLAELDAFNGAAGKNASLFSYYNDFSSGFDAAGANAVLARGAQPMITWEPWDPNNGTVNQPQYSLGAIAGGAYDSYISGWARQVRAWGHPLFLRFAHEMNANWYPWAEGVNGNTAGQYVAAWRHVHDLFVAAGATNVQWVWSPNAAYPGSTPLPALYPGDAYVTWVAVDGYNWGTTQSWGSTWQSFTDVFGETLGQLRQLTHRPIMIGETASAEQGGDKAQWISGFFSGLAANPDIKGFVWFNMDKETDWRIQSSPAATSAFATGVAAARYLAG